MSQGVPLAEWVEPPAGGVVRFGVFQLDCGTGELRKSGVLVRLRQQPFKVLEALLARPGQVVSRDELRARLWGDETYVDFDQGLNSAIKEIRAALGDSSDTPLYVETLPRRGYRFIAPVIAPVEARGVVAPSSPPPPVERARWSRRAAVPVTLAAVALGAIAILARRGTPEPTDWRQLTFRQGAVSSARFAPNGDVAITAAWDGGPPRMQILTPGVPDARTLSFENAHVFAVLQGGEVAYVHAPPGGTRVLSRAPLAGGPAKEVLERVLEADAAGDGTFAVIHAVPNRGATIEYPIGQALTPVNAPSNLRVSPTGRHLAVIEHRTGLEEGGWVLILDRDGRRVAYSATFALVTGLAWAPSGDEVLFTASREGANTAIRALAVDGRERLVMAASGRLVLHDIGPDGRAVVERSTVRSEVRWSGGGSVERDLSWFDGGRVVALSADGRSLLMNETGEAGGRGYGVYVRPTDGAPPVRIGAGRATALSDDARWAVTVPIEEPSHIALLPVGAGEVRRIRHAGIAQYEWGRLLPGGEQVVFAGGEPGHNFRVWIGDVAGGRARALTPEGLSGRGSLVSVEARLVVAGCPPLRLCAYPMDGSAPIGIEGVTESFALGLDGSGLGLLVRPRAAAFPVAVDRVDLRTGARSQWRVLAPPDLVGAGLLRGLTTSADDSAFAYDFERRRSQLYLVDRLE